MEAPAMITPAHPQLMARYNRWQNRSLLNAADRLSDAQRKEQRGAFFGSVHGTLSHILFADQIWLYRFTGNEAVKPVGVTTIAESVTAIPDWADLKQRRAAFDETIIGWAEQMTAPDLAGDVTWHSGALGREVSRSKWELVTHLFNHQTHHRGQVHCLLTGFGQKPDDTDIPFMPE
jgi:uncharacterized damage-inducible protein DinB